MEHICRLIIFVLCNFLISRAADGKVFFIVTDQEKSLAQEVHTLLDSAHPQRDDIDLAKAAALASP